MIQRKLTEQVLRYASLYPAVAILGPRQSGKTTLAQTTFKQHRYLSLEDLDNRELAHADPRKFLEIHRNNHGIILDEFQNVPSLLSYIQTFIDQEKIKGYFIFTGSQNFLVNQTINQTLAGRVALLTLLPLSLE